MSKLEENNDIKQIREGLIKSCRYYDGSDIPKGNARFWGYEKVWVEMCIRDDIQLVEHLEQLHRYLPSWFNNERAPMSLKALLLSRYLHFLTVFDERDFTNWFNMYMAGE